MRGPGAEESDVMVPKLAAPEISSAGTGNEE